ncbi:MAG: hypothetical protein Q4F35_08680, partial [Akkermansia sp.]|nr:hypothetical protein [Akkermansia sp.]
MKKTLLALSLCVVSFAGFALAEDVSYTLPEAPIWTAANATAQKQLSESVTSYTLVIDLKEDALTGLFDKSATVTNPNYIFKLNAKDDYSLSQTKTVTEVEEGYDDNWDPIITTKISNGLTLCKNDVSNFNTVFNTLPEGKELTAAALTMAVYKEGEATKASIGFRLVWDNEEVAETFGVATINPHTLTKIQFNKDLVDKAYMIGESVASGAMDTEGIKALNLAAAPIIEVEPEPDTPTQPDTP